MSAAAVRADLEAYRVATAELPARAVAARDGAGAVVVVDGQGSWWRDAATALERGAAAVVVARPDVAPVEAIDDLTARAGTRPVVVERALLRADAVDAVGAAFSGSPAALTIECQAHAGHLPAALRDAIGWARALAGSPLRRRSGTSAGGRALALLEAEAGAAVSVVAAMQPGAPPLGRTRITALGETLVEIDDDGGDLVAAVTDAAGRRVLPRRFERPERVALRRAIDAVGSGRGPDDLAGLRHDTALARAVLTAPYS